MLYEQRVVLHPLPSKINPVLQLLFEGGSSEMGP